MNEAGIASDAITLTNVEKLYGGLRPLRVRDIRIAPAQITMILGFDAPAAQVFVDLVTGATLPDSGVVVSLGRATSEIADGDEWLSFVERFGIVSDRIVLLDALTVAQNLAISFDLELEPVPPHVRALVTQLGAEVGIDESLLETRVGDAAPLLRSRVCLARALALNPAIMILEHPTAKLPREHVLDFAQTIRTVSSNRGLTTVGVLMDEAFAKASGGRLLYWQPATGEARARSRFALRWSKGYF
jgi:ABC-type transporter Mla maintaining outer membrane lipid asymmetry ATPase subunit MlaF